jgi:hypothetical protein
MTYTYAIIHVSQRTYDEIRSKLESVGYQDQIDHAGNLDMHGMALAADRPGEEPSTEVMVEQLLAAGWKKFHNHPTEWIHPQGGMFRGPHKAWHVMRGESMCKPRE